MSDQTDQTDPKKTLDGHEVETALLSDWRIMFNTLQARFRTGDFATGLQLVDGIGAAAEEMNHHPDLDLRYPTVHVRLSSHDVGGITQRDIDLARQISDLAGRLGAKADPDAVQVLEIALDTADREAIKPFWSAVLGLTDSQTHDDELNDPSGILPTIWFQETDAHEEPRQRFHLDIRVPPEVAERRVQEALQAGGTMVSDARAPSFWVLADAQGNKACVCTWLGRSAT
jgi:4a-hydroxytetrahydrobiopterin dehydratase